MNNLDREIAGHAAQTAPVATISRRLRQWAIGFAAIVTIVFASSVAYADGGLRVRGYDGFNTLPDSPIEVTDSTGKVVSPTDAKTDSTGRYAQDLPAGDYTVEVRNPSGGKGVKTITVTDGVTPTRHARIEIGDTASSAAATSTGSAAVQNETVVSGSVGASVSRVDNNSKWGTGTVVIGPSEKFGVRLDNHILRNGIDAKVKVSTPSTFIFSSGRGRVKGGYSYAAGSDSASGTATVGAGGVNQIALTFLFQDSGLGTGVASAAANDVLASSVRVDNSWSLGYLGYGESMNLNGPGSAKISVGGAVVFEQFENSFSADADIIRGGNSLAHQSTSAYTKDTYYGYKLTAGFSQPFFDGKLRVGLAGFVIPAYHEGEANISLTNNFGNGASQSLSHDNNGFAVSGGVRLGTRLKLGTGLSVGASYEYSLLDEVSDVNLAENPIEQPASFDSDVLDRHTFRFTVGFRF